MWKAIVLVLLLQNFYCQSIDILRCCKDHESVVLTRYGNRNNIECQPNGEDFNVKIISGTDNRITDIIPWDWNFQYSFMPDCPDMHELSFIPYKMNNRTGSHYKLYEDGILRLYLRGEEIVTPSGYCLANNALMACRPSRPYRPVEKKFKKCCGQNGIIRDTHCANNKNQTWSMVEDLNNLLKITNDYFKINDIVIESGFPYCPDKDLTLSHATYYMYQSDASLILDGSHAIAAGEFCIERERFDDADHIAVYTCAKDAHSPSQNFNNRPALTSRKLRKCCQENEVLKNSVCIKEDNEWNMKENLRDLLQITNQYLDYVDIVSSYPTCRDNNFNTHKLWKYELQRNVSIKLNNRHLIPSEEFCLERDKTYGRDVAVAVTCSNYVDSSQNYINSEAVMSNSPKTFRKCCQENYILKNFSCVQGDIQWTLEKDLSDLINNTNDYFNINNIRIASGYPNCPNDNWNFTRVNYMPLQFMYDASVRVNHYHVIPADKFCLDRDRIYGKDYIILVTCPENALSNSQAVRSNMRILILFVFLHYIIKIIF